MRWLAFTAMVLMVAAGCAAPPPSHFERVGTDPSLPGIIVSANASLDGDAWHAFAKAVNQGSRTYKVDTFCQSPFGLEAKADQGEAYYEAQCLAYAQPVAFKPGETVKHTWTIKPAEFRWQGTAHFTVHFSDAEGVGEISIVLS